MSSILKALRKLEEEKARRQQGTPDIAHDILCGNFQRRRASGPAVLCAVFMAILICGGLGYWFATFDISETGSGDTAIVDNESPIDPQQSPIRPTTSSPSQVVALRQDAATSGDTQEVIEAESSGTVALEKVSVSSGRTTQPLAASEEASAFSSPEPAIAASARSAPVFLLSGIAYQSDPDSRMAIINDLPVMRGTVIDGARVEEILNDRVQLSFGKQRIEVRLGRADAGK